MSDALQARDVNQIVRRLPRPLRELLEAHPAELFIAGGFIRSCIANEPVNDIDVFSSSKELAERYAREYTARLPGSGLLLPDILATDNAFTLAEHKPVVQFIHRWSFSDPEKCIQSFDFTIAKAAIWCEPVCRWRSACDFRFYGDLAAKRLIYCSPDREEDAGRSMLRVLKFYQRGYRIPLDSLGDVMARIYRVIDTTRALAAINGTNDRERNQLSTEGTVGRRITELLCEVDPMPEDVTTAYLPTEVSPDA